MSGPAIHLMEKHARESACGLPASQMVLLNATRTLDAVTCKRCIAGMARQEQNRELQAAWEARGQAMRKELGESD